MKTILRIADRINPPLAFLIVMMCGATLRTFIHDVPYSEARPYLVGLVVVLAIKWKDWT